MLRKSGRFGSGRRLLCRENGSGPQAAEGKTRKAETEPAAGALTDGAPHTRETHVRR